MEKKLHYLAGWIDTSIHDFLAEIEGPPSSMRYALVTCLDSSFDVAALVTERSQLQALKERCSVVGKGVLLTTSQLLRIERQKRLFFGFDEVWFFSHSEVSPKPTNFTITGPDRITPQLLRELEEWMQSNGGSLGLGDGTGMNYCARLRGVARYIVGALEAESSEPANDWPIAFQGTAPVEPE